MRQLVNKLKMIKTILLLICLTVQSISMAHYAEDFTEAKKVARLIWAEHRETFYCGCKYDRQGNIDFKSCSFSPGNQYRSKRISWEHIVPVSWYGKQRPCWKKNQRQKPREACRQQDPDFRRMEADLHNLVPALREINMKRKHYAYGNLPPGSCMGCDFVVNNHLQMVEPRDEVKGMAARIMLYMIQKYNISIKEAQKQVLIQWNHRFPPDGWEKRWHEKVSTIQGDRNPYIDHYKTNKKRG